MINFDEFDLNAKIETKSNFSLSDFGINTLLGCKFNHKVAFNVLSMTLALYPLERVQQIKQIQNTYSSESIKFCNNIFSTIHPNLSPMFSLWYQIHFPRSQGHFIQKLHALLNLWVRRQVFIPAESTCRIHLQRLSFYHGLFNHLSFLKY